MRNTKVSKVMLSAILGITVFFGGVGISAQVEAPETKSETMEKTEEKTQSPIVLEKDETQIEPSSDLFIVDKQIELEEIKAEGIRLQKERKEAFEKAVAEEKARLAKIEAERIAKGEAERKAREEAERQRLAKIEAERQVKLKREVEAKRKAEEKARQQRVAEQKKQQNSQQQHKKTQKSQGSGMSFNGSYYTPYCTGCSGVTATGVDVRKSIYYQGMRVVAVDPRVIPLYSIVQVTTPYESFKAIALDTGGAIKGHKIDILVADKATAYKLGRHTVRVTILKSGK